MSEKNIRAIFKDEAIRCEVCECEICGGVDCDCGIDGEDHIGYNEALDEKNTYRYEIETQAKIKVKTINYQLSEIELEDQSGRTIGLSINEEFYGYKEGDIVRMEQETFNELYDDQRMP